VSLEPSLFARGNFDCECIEYTIIKAGINPIFLVDYAHIKKLLKYEVID
jgi:hypothetical protein